MTRVRTHYLGPRDRKTACGLSAERRRNHSLEAYTDRGDVIAVALSRDQATCLRCINAKQPPPKKMTDEERKQAALRNHRAIQDAK